MSPLVHCLVFDIETVPDVEFGRRLLDLEGMSDAEVGEVMFARRRQDTGGEFLSLEQHRVIAISVALRTRETFRLWSLGDLDSSEADLISRFFEGIEKYTPDLISWNGSGFDLPVLHYRCLKHGIAAPRYWETGDEDQTFRFNNYLNRFHWRHLDLMDVLAGYQNRGRAGLDAVSTLIGLPGKLGMAGDQVWAQYRAGNLQGIRDYCETDVLNTYLVYLRFQLIRGHMSPPQHVAEIQRIRDYLAGQSAPHLQQFLAAWP
ncbi:MAG TPA: 3'-5' exonuclease [Steroidobacteraceae bacterium]|nr:3'-5' exonuclease [Steroidobacteraceae bacterium]